MGLPRIAAYPLPEAHELPAPRGPWRLEPRRAALLIHDMQNYFVGAFTPGASPIEPAIENMRRLAARCRSAEVPVFYTCQRGDQDPRDRGLQKDIWGPGMTSAPEHQGVVERLLPAPGDLVLTKHRYSAFQRSNLETMMRARGRDQLVVCGVFGHIGCMLTAAEAFQRDIEAFLIADAVADFSRELHDWAVRYVAERCGVSMTTSEAEAVFT